MPKTVGARELKTRLGTYLQQVMAGTSLLVTERGRPVAELRPLPPAGGDDRECLAALVHAGLLTGGGGAMADFPPIEAPDAPLSDEVVRGREDRL